MVTEKIRTTDHFNLTSLGALRQRRMLSIGEPVIYVLVFNGESKIENITSQIENLANKRNSN